MLTIKQQQIKSLMETCSIENLRFAQGCIQAQLLQKVIDAEKRKLTEDGK